MPAGIADTVTTQPLAPGVRLHHLVRNRGPLRAWVLDVERAACVSVAAVKGGAVAVGRATTSALLRGVDPTRAPIAAVNADFFLFAPPGIPTGAHVEDGRLLSGPVERPVFATNDDGTPWIGRLRVQGTVTSQRGTLAVTHWNRAGNGEPALFDAAWGVPLDSSARPGALRLVPLAGGAYVVRAMEPAAGATGVPSGVTTPHATAPVAHGDTLLLTGARRGDAGVPQPGDTVRVTRRLLPRAPRHAVGGFPRLVADSAIVPQVDSAGAASFRGLNPRTAVGIAASGRRLLLVVIDGRQPGHSVGATTRETAALLRDLGAHDAVNLDGGGSSTMVVRDGAAPGGTRLVNRPSDAAGERPVANALAVLGRCDGARR